MSKTIIPNCANPLIVSDFLTDQLNNNDGIEVQVLSLRTIFILLEKYGLDYPNYYTKLYDMIKPRIKEVDTGVYDIVTIFKMSEKSRFLRLLDLSLRSPKLSTVLVAAFLKRLCRIVVSYGEGCTTQDIMFVVSFTANMLKRHPRCQRLINRKFKEGATKTID